jgi:uncharacterized damage-inducible protein DinB
MSLLPTIAWPKPHQHPAWASYYLDQVPQDGAILTHLQLGWEALREQLSPLPEEQWLYRYAADKWSVKEVVVHLMDVERVFAYRALTVARADKTPLPSFDHDAYVPRSEADSRTPASLMAEYSAQRVSTIQFFSHLSEQALDQVGEASGHPISARALVYMIAGHEAHHAKILRERYLG